MLHEFNNHKIDLNLLMLMFFIIFLLAGGGMFFLANKFLDRLFPPNLIEKPAQPSKIIWLNGASSCGKSSLAKQLQQELNEPFLLLKMDSLIGMMPPKLNDWTGKTASASGFSWLVSTDPNGEQTTSLQMGTYAVNLMDSLKKVAATLAKNGHNLIIDQVSLSAEDFQAWQQHLAPFKTFYVGLFANDQTLKQREQQRTDRIFGSAVPQNQLVHLGKTYDFALEVDQLTPQAAAQAIKRALHAKGFDH